MSITRRGVGGSRFLAVPVFALLLASGCRSTTSTGEPAEKVEHAPENAPVTLNLGPATLDSFGADSGASCSDAGPPSTGLDGGSSCGATLAASTFQYAICSCGSLQSTGVLTTDGYDSTQGGPTGALGANVGFNASAAWSSAPSLGGNLFSPGGISAPKGGLVRGDLHLGGAVQGGGQTFTVDGNAFVEATLPSSVKVLGTTSHVSSVASPCNCNSPLPIASLVSAHAAPNSEDSAIGLSASAAGGGNPSQIDLPCGDFYLTVISPSKALTIAAHGHTELYIAGAVSTSNALTFSIDPGASLDLFVAGGFSATGTLHLGSTSSPSSCRAYVAGSQFQVPSSASIACNIYAPSASIALPSTVAYGAIYANGVTASGSATLHYDTSIQGGSCAPTCTAASCDDENPCTSDSCNSNGTCSHTNAANGTSCPTGANLCDQSYTCQSGVCTGSNPVTCTAQDQCHGVGTCNQSTGTCSNPALANGTSCNDGNACTQTDSCQTGVCTGSNPVTCTAPDSCHSGGACNASTGVCSAPTLNAGFCYIGSACVASGATNGANTCETCQPGASTSQYSNVSNGTSCNDGNACDLNDSCQSGVCTAGSHVTCTAPDSCHSGGACNASTGVCSAPTLNAGFCYIGSACVASGAANGANTCQTCQPGASTSQYSNVSNGTSCNDGNACTQVDTCQAGACTGSNPVVCTPNDPCHVAGSCNPSTGACSNPTVADGTACNDGNACTQSDFCVGGTCTGSNPVVCAAIDVCHSAGTCNPTTGACSGPAQSLCPPVDSTVGTTIFGSTAFLYSGANPSQTGVAPGTIVAQRAVVLRGRVLDRSSNPVPGVVATILNHPELGTTLTQSDGTYTMVVNGGGPLTVNLAASRYLPVQRTVPTPWNDYAIVPDVVVTPLDVATTSINLADTSGYQVARATTVTDSDGSRTATLVFPPGTQALLNSGTSSVPITNLTVRATEYTVGATGPAAMPGNLPANVGYTYAVEFTADEELALGVNADIQFSSPIVSYTDNFLHFTAGVHIPVGSYDRTTGAWVALPDGLAINIVSITGGLANIDVTGDGVADPPATLAALGITPAEQAEIATIYPTPTSIWRVPIPHFSRPFDFNLGYGPKPPAIIPNEPPAGPPPIPPQICLSGDSGNTSNLPASSQIECDNGILHEAVPIAGTPFSLTYSSDRVAGYAASNRLIIPLSGATMSPTAVRIDLEVDVAGRSFTTSFPPSPNQTATFDWDGKDVLGRTLQGGQTASISVGYVYPGVYLTPSENPGGVQYDELFGHFSYFGTPATTDPTRMQVTLLQKYTSPIGRTVGHWSSESLALGGWMLDAQAVYEPGARVIHFGDGTNVSPAWLPQVLTTMATPGFQPGPIAVGPDGNLYVVDQNLPCVYLITPSGVSSRFAGTCVTGYSGDGGPALAAQMTPASDVAIGPDGSLYIAEGQSNRVRRVDTAGIITTVAGTGSAAFSGDGGPATQATLNNPAGVDVAPDGTLYIADFYNGRIRRVSPDGVISTFAGGAPNTGSCGNNDNGTGGPANAACLSDPFRVRVAPDGSLYVAEGFLSLIRRITPDGIIHQFATPAGDIALGADGSLFLTNGNYVQRIDPTGATTTAAGFPGNFGSSFGNNVPAVDAAIGLPSVRVGPDGALYVSDEYGYRVCKVGPPLAGFSNPSGVFQFSSADGSRVYTFDGTGRHLTTLDAITGAVLYRFGYTAGLLTSVTDVNNDTTTITRDSSGNPLSITSPFRITTTLQNGSDGYLASIQDPTGAMHQMAYSSGLLSTIQFPSGFTSSKTYDPLGRVLTSTDAAGGELTFTRDPDTLSSIGVTKQTSRNVSTHYAVTVGASNSSSWATQLPGNLTSTQQIGVDSSQAVTSPDGTQTSTAYTGDPRFGMLTPIPSTTTVKLPSGLTSTTTMTRAVTIGTGSTPLTALTDTTVVNGHTWTRAFAAGPPAIWTTTSPVGRTSSMTIDSAGRPLTTSVPSVAPLSFLYDSHGRLQQTTQGSRTWLTGYDANGYASSQTDPLSHTVSTLNDLDGRPLTTTLQDQREVGTSWDGDGNMLNITLPGALATQPDPSREHQFSFTPVDSTQSYTPPSIGSGLPATTYAYDADRFLRTIARPDSVTVTRVPDAFERLSQIQYPQGALSYGYSPTTGQLLTTTTPGGETTTFTYDGFLQKSITWSGPVAGSIAFGYNSDFHVTSQSLNGGTGLTFGYDTDGLLTCAGASTCPASGALGLSLDLHNGRLNATALGSIADAYGYDANGLLASYAATFSGSGALYSETIVSRDLNGRITEKTDVLAGTSHDWKYVYDVAGRLADVTEDGNFEAHYGYDGDDNRTTFTNAGGTVNPTYDVQDRLSAYGPATYAYTANGELTSKTVGGQVTSYTYDALGNLLHVGLPAALPDGAQTIDYVVDGQNRRVGRMVNGILVQGWLYQDQLRPVAQLDGSGTNVVARFVYGSKANVPDYMITSGGTYRILSDHLGSPRAVVDVASGNLIETINFDEFGNETDALAGTLPTGYVRIPFGFAGGLYDPDTGLVRFGARDYDASVGRWTAKDPKRFQGGGINLYGYALHDPINRRDPHGTDIASCLGEAVEAANICELRCKANNTPWNNICAWFNGTNTFSDCIHQCRVNLTWSEEQCWKGSDCDSDENECLAMQ